jgi:hypothetical protein
MCEMQRGFRPSLLIVAIQDDLWSWSIRVAASLGDMDLSAFFFARQIS